MKTEINKSAKRALSLVIAFALLIGSLFTANVGVNIKANAETTETTGFLYWDGTATPLTDEDLVDGTYIIKTAEQLNWVCTVVGGDDGKATTGKKYKVDPSIKAFVLQKESDIAPYLSQLLALSDGEETRVFFEETLKNVTKQNWMQNLPGGNGIFNGDFDGSGVPIYGLYASGITYGKENCALFPGTDGGGDTDYSVVENTAFGDGITLENIVIKNSYFQGHRRLGAITSTSWWASATNANVNGCANIKSCVVGNCYFLGQNKSTSGTTVYLNRGKSTNTSDTRVVKDEVLTDFPVAIGEMAVLAGSMGNDPAMVDSCMMYGNLTEYDHYSCASATAASDGSYFVKVTDNGTLTGPVTTKNTFNRTFAANGTKGSNYGTLTNSILIGTKSSGLNANTDTITYTENNYTFYDVETLRGASAMAWANGLAWGEGWYAVEGELPTPIEPLSYIPVNETPDNLYAGGDGTKEKPYIIRSVDQLSEMISSTGSYENGTTTSVPDSGGNTVEYTVHVPYYYQVASDVKEIYINDATTKEEIKALVDANGHRNWYHDDTYFYGNFDGNGVTIYGMASTGTYNGFIPVLGSGAVIKNVIFKGAYVSGDRAAVVTSNQQIWSANGADKPNSYLANIAVVDSYIESTKAAADIVNTTKNTHIATAGGIMALSTDPDHVVLTNCLYDGGSSTLIDSIGTTAGANELSPKAGIVAMGHTGNEVTLNNCVSINEYLVPMVTSIAQVSAPYLSSTNTGGGYRRYLSADTASSVEFRNCYSTVNSNMNNAVEHDLLSEIRSIDATKTKYTTADAILLDWANVWTLVVLDSGRTIPMPIGLASEELPESFSQKLAAQNDNNGANALGGRRSGFTKGTYGMYNTFKGSGTEKDPYLIDSALKLAQAIACGGKNINQKLYYKLTCDIDLSGHTWIDQVAINGKYVYVPFEGTLDGANYTITGLSAVDSESAGLIPVLNGGTVKNVHIRNSYAGSNAKAGLIAGTVNAGSTIQNCSVEGSLANGSDSTIFGNWTEATTNADVSNCYIAYEGNAQYVFDTEEIKTVDTITDVYSSKNTGAAWYKGPDGVARHVAAAKAHTVTDVDGDGIFGDTYTTNDIAALRKSLLGETAYANIYGDVNNDGNTNISDLAILRREIVGTYNTIKDGFWRNVEVGKISIYYGSNDNYDAARKLELALESMLPGVDIKKVVSASSTVTGASSNSSAVYVHSKDETGTPDGQLEFIVGNIANSNLYATNTIATAENTYAVSYDPDNYVVWLQGSNFTAVEQAVVNFIANSSPITGAIYTSGSTALANEKKAKTYNGTTYYYSWGDEFNATALDEHTWGYGSMHNETTHNEDGSSNRHANLEVAFPEDMAKLYTVDGNKLTISRGYYADSTNSTADGIGWKWLGKLSDKGVTSEMSGTTDKGVSVEGENYISNKFGGRVESTDTFATAGLISTHDSVLAKQGYLEMRATYPSDGHVFACWWLMGFNGTTNNNAISDSLFGKVFKLNNDAAYSNTDIASQYAWNGTNVMDSRYPNTFKYQLPNSTFEIDIAELMQADSNAKNTYQKANFTFHKFYRNGVYEYGGVKKIKFIDWDNLLTGNTAYYSVSNKLSRSGSFLTGGYQYSYDTASSTDTFLYDSTRNITKGTLGAYPWTWDGGMLQTSTDAGPYFSGTPGYVNVKGGTEYIFGVEWKANGSGGATFAFTVKEAASGNSATLALGDGSESTVASGTLTVTDTNFDEKDSFGSDNVFLENLAQLETDAQTMNQYMYMLIDNTYYTSANSEGSSPYTDLLTASDPSGNTGDTTQMIIDYVRIYQNKRDLVTDETEDFNNGNHFGY